MLLNCPVKSVSLADKITIENGLSNTFSGWNKLTSGQITDQKQRNLKKKTIIKLSSTCSSFSLVLCRIINFHAVTVQAYCQIWILKSNRDCEAGQWCKDHYSTGKCGDSDNLVWLNYRSLRHFNYGF